MFARVLYGFIKIKENTSRRQKEQFLLIFRSSFRHVSSPFIISEAAVPSGCVETAFKTSCIIVSLLSRRRNTGKFQRVLSLRTVFVVAKANAAARDGCAAETRRVQ